CKPARETFAFGGPQTVDVECDDSHRALQIECNPFGGATAASLATAAANVGVHQRAASLQDGGMAPFAILDHRPKGSRMSHFRQDFLAFALAREVLRFGEFVTKAGRKSPYFFNAGLFNDGASLRELGRFYAQALRDSGLSCDGLFGPAYKGITLVAATAIGLAEI